MKTILAPDGKAEVSYLKAQLIGGHGEDVAVMDVLSEQTVPTSLGLGNIMVLQACKSLLLSTDFRHPFRMARKRDVCIRMLTHIGWVKGLHGSERRLVRLYLLDKAHTGVVNNPVAEIMEARGVAVELAVAIAEHTELAQIVGEGLLATGYTKPQGHTHLDESGAVEFAGVDDQVLVVREEFKGMGHIGSTHELTGHVKWVISGRFGQQSYNHQAVLLGVGHLLGL